MSLDYESIAVQEFSISNKKSKLMRNIGLIVGLLFSLLLTLAELHFNNKFSHIISSFFLGLGMSYLFAEIFQIFGE